MVDKSEIKKFLLDNASESGKKFQEKIVYTRLTIYGIGIPKLRKFARVLAKNGFVPDDIEPTSSEEITLKGLVLSKQKWSDLKVIEEYEKFNSLIDNWATCDTITPSLKQLKTESGRRYLFSLLENSNFYKKRIGVIGLMVHFLDDKNLDEIINALVSLSNTLSSKTTYSFAGTTEEKIENLSEYYVKMAISWYLCTLICKNYDYGKCALQKFTDKFIRNKTISKCHDSFRLSPNQKEELKKLKL